MTINCLHLKYYFGSKNPIYPIWTKSNKFEIFGSLKNVHVMFFLGFMGFMNQIQDSFSNDCFLHLTFLIFFQSIIYKDRAEGKILYKKRYQVDNVKKLLRWLRQREITNDLYLKSN